MAYTPGHASHHVSYFNADTGIAFVGDTAGVKLQSRRLSLPPTPPPDIDLESWRESLDTHRGLAARDAVSHAFRPGGPVRPHLAEIRDHLADACSPAIAGEDGQLERPAEPMRNAKHGSRIAMMRELRTAGERGGGPALRSGRPVRSELARAGAILEKEGAGERRCYALSAVRLGMGCVASGRPSAAARNPGALPPRVGGVTR